MKINELKAFIKEELKKALKSNQPATAPNKPTEKPGPAVAPGKPGIDKPKPRRPLGNPDVKPAPKAMNEEEMLDKIVARFKSKKVDEELSPIQIQKLKKISTRLNKKDTPSNLSGSDEANFTKSLKKQYNPIKKDDMPLDKYLASKK
jgi:hypothetical protein